MLFYAPLLIIILSLLYNFFIYYHILLILILVIPVFLLTSVRSSHSLYSILSVFIYWGYFYIIITVLSNSINTLLIISLFNEIIVFVFSTSIINFIIY